MRETPLPLKRDPLSSPADTAEDRLAHLLKQHPWMSADALGRKTTAILGSNAGFREKHRQLVALADNFNQALRPITACRMGCSDCCSLKTLIYRYEAKVMAVASGRRLKIVPYRPPALVIAANRTLASTWACPFRVSGRCSVYAYRPMICRLHHSLNDDPTNCNVALDVSQRRVVMYDPDHIEVPYHELVRSYYPREPWGTIDEFFAG